MKPMGNKGGFVSNGAKFVSVRNMTMEEEDWKKHCTESTF